MRSTTVRLWRWRRNPLRRRSDVVEAWVTAVALLLVLIFAPFAGFVAGHALDSSAAHQRTEVHRVTAVLQQNAPVLAGTASQAGSSHVQVPVRWKAYDGAVHTGTTLVPQGLKAGTPVVVWADHAARLVPPPPSAAQGLALAVTGGIGAAAGVCLLVMMACSLIRTELDHLRMGEWDREWADKGPRWSHGRT
ncbi:hypothetical protein NGB36_22130 [Streptomyces sp. RB6PN25]|uniref:Integral membrane protein n=1 Tax=Streptomyces humicola TaxID=2953240 RepID=A0ABT1Q003_9ACTN|nr:hypothetical protein [Streptomyces humicola]MCQ4083226.1 hypothetical protein [Streptomyces humicola]